MKNIEASDSYNNILRIADSLVTDWLPEIEFNEIRHLHRLSCL